MATTSFSRQLLQQSTIDAENFVRNDLATAHSLAIDLAALDGTGEDNQPLGLLRTPGVGSVTMGPSGGAPTYAKIVDLETAIADVNADADRMKILTTPIMRGILKKTPAVNTTYGALPVWQNSGSPGVGDVAGYQGYVSKQVPATKVTTDLSHSDCHCIILGYWPSLYVGEWGLLTLIVDPYTAKKRGMIEVTSFQMVDIGVRHPESFAAIQDARNV
jgi:HK97 family phage major capsid protein